MRSLAALTMASTGRRVMSARATSIRSIRAEHTSRHAGPLSGPKRVARGLTNCTAMPRRVLALGLLVLRGKACSIRHPVDRGARREAGAIRERDAVQAGGRRPRSTADRRRNVRSHGAPEGARDGSRAVTTKGIDALAITR